MSTGLASLLVHEGHVSAGRMIEAFRRQVIYGGSLDTTLLEMNLVEEEALCHYLARAAGLPVAGPDEVPAGDLEGAARLVPLSVAERCRAVPVSLARATLTLFVGDPIARSQLEQLGKSLRLSLAPLVVPEYRLFQAMARVYGVTVPTRYAMLARRIASRRQDRTQRNEGTGFRGASSWTAAGPAGRAGSGSEAARPGGRAGRPGSEAARPGEEAADRDPGGVAVQLSPTERTAPAALPKASPEAATRRVLILESAVGPRGEAGGIREAGVGEERTLSAPDAARAPAARAASESPAPDAGARRNVRPPFGDELTAGESDAAAIASARHVRPPFGDELTEATRSEAGGEVTAGPGGSVPSTIAAEATTAEWIGAGRGSAAEEARADESGAIRRGVADGVAAIAAAGGAPGTDENVAAIAAVDAIGADQSVAAIAAAESAGSEEGVTAIAAALGFGVDERGAGVGIGTEERGAAIGTGVGFGADQRGAGVGVGTEERDAAVGAGVRFGRDERGGASGAGVRFGRDERGGASGAGARFGRDERGGASGAGVRFGRDERGGASGAGARFGRDERGGASGAGVREEGRLDEDTADVHAAGGGVASRAAAEETAVVVTADGGVASPVAAEETAAVVTAGGVASPVLAEDTAAVVTAGGVASPVLAEDTAAVVTAGGGVASPVAAEETAVVVTGGVASPVAAEDTAAVTTAGGGVASPGGMGRRGAKEEAAPRDAVAVPLAADRREARTEGRRPHDAARVGAGLHSRGTDAVARFVDGAAAPQPKDAVATTPVLAAPGVAPRAAMVARGATDGARAARVESAPAAAALDPPPIDLPEGLRILEETIDRDEIFLTVLRIARARFDFAVLFVVQEHHAVARRGVGDRWYPPRGLERVSVSLGRHSAMRAAVLGCAPYVGQLGLDPAMAEAMLALGRLAPLWGVLVPIVLRGRTVAIIYADGAGEVRGPECLTDLGRAAQEAGQAFQRIILRTKTPVPPADDDVSGPLAAPRSPTDLSAPLPLEARFSGPAPPDLLALIAAVAAGGVNATAAAANLLAAGERGAHALVVSLPERVRARRSAASGELYPLSQYGALVELLPRFGHPAVPYLVAALASPATEVRLCAALVLGELPYPEVVPALGARLFDADPAVRRAAAAALGHYGPSPSLHALLESLRLELADPRPVRQRAAADALGELRDVASVPRLIELLRHRDELLVVAVRRALVTITRHDFAASRWRWRSWWESNRHRSRADWLLDALAERDPAQRRAASDELAALASERYGYHVTLPRRVREEAHLRWTAWYKEHSRELPPTPAPSHS